jgi:hypothetical protein
MLDIRATPIWRHSQPPSAPSGAVEIETVVLLTTAEIDEAAKEKVSSRSPGA